MLSQQAIVSRWGLWGIFLLSLLSATLLPGFSEAGLVALVASGRFRPWSLVLYASAGNWIGGAITYGMGWALGMSLTSEWTGISVESIDGVRAWVESYGAWCGLLVWVPVIGDPIAAALGLAHSPVVGTLVLMLVGKAARYICVVFASDGVLTVIRRAIGTHKRKDNDKENSKI